MTSAKTADVIFHTSVSSKMQKPLFFLRKSKTFGRITNFQFNTKCDKFNVSESHTTKSSKFQITADANSLKTKGKLRFSHCLGFDFGSELKGSMDRGAGIMLEDG